MIAWERRIAVATDQQGYKRGKGWSKEKIESKKLWHTICEKHTDEYGVRHCYTWQCPMSKVYCCYQYPSYEEFEKSYYSKIKSLRRDIKAVARMVMASES